ncbi:MAG: A/G-specific adenine glycosylase, partial [Acidimicrobiales bacterium]
APAARAPAVPVGPGAPPAGLRDLPWRRTRDPWRVLVSETMLQQTQVARVLGPYRVFVARFPTPAACAGAPAGEVVRAWAGLGYNRRALHLHAAASACVERHCGAVPASLDELRALPGVGAYTSRAVLAFAFEVPVGVVDTNAARVLARAVAGRALRPAEAQALADRLVPPRRAWAHNQAMLDVGAGYCTSRGPACGSCPLRRRCKWGGGGRAGPDPAAGSAGTSRPQSPFAGSARQGRGRLVAALRTGPVAVPDLAAAAGWPGEPVRARRAAEALVAEGLARWSRASLSLD